MHAELGKPISLPKGEATCKGRRQGCGQRSVEKANAGL